MVKRPEDALMQASNYVDPNKTITAGQIKTLKGLKGLDTAINTVMVVGTVLDIAGNLADNREAKKMEREQEKNLRDKDKRAKKSKRKYQRKHKGPLATSGIVQDMFSQSTGHTRYGASKLPGL